MNTVDEGDSVFGVNMTCSRRSWRFSLVFILLLLGMSVTFLMMILKVRYHSDHFEAQGGPIRQNGGRFVTLL